MSPEKAKVFIVEDNDVYRDTNTIFLENSGHFVVETATSRREALAKIPSLSKKGVNVAVVDANLSKRGISGGDGEEIAKAIKSQHPKITVIGNAARNSIDSADINCPKIKGPSELAKTVTSA
jgi:DNA-binding NtrC family response regulator